MKVRLKVSRAYKGGRVELPGDVVDVSDAEAGRLIVSGQAEAVDAKAGKKVAKAVSQTLGEAERASLVDVKREIPPADDEGK